MDIVYQDKDVRIEIEESEIPWLKVFTQHPYREMSQLPEDIRSKIYELLDIIEREMLAYYEPDKINIASFGNYMPHLHWHIMARFKSDSYFPEPMWGSRQREGDLDLPCMDRFCRRLTREIIRYETELQQ